MGAGRGGVRSFRVSLTGPSFLWSPRRTSTQAGFRSTSASLPKAQLTVPTRSLFPLLYIRTRITTGTKGEGGMEGEREEGERASESKGREGEGKRGEGRKGDGRGEGERGSRKGGWLWQLNVPTPRSEF